MNADPISSLSGGLDVPIGLISRPVGAPIGPLPDALPSVGPAVSGPYTPAQLRHAYGVDQLSYDGTGQTIGIVDAYDDPSAAADLAAFDSRFSLPPANLVTMTPTGQTKPVSNSGWDLEISLDIEYAHVIAPMAKILLVEANDESNDNLLGAVDFAVAQGANQVSMSWGEDEPTNESSLDYHFDHPGVTFLAASGDSGAGVEFPAASPYVTGVGGTTLSLDASGNKISETAWSGSGGGTSSQYSVPTYQKGFQNASNRGVPDVSYDADPNSGVYVYDNKNWYSVGGTSAGAPQWAGLMALVNQGLAAKNSSMGVNQPEGTNVVLYQLAGKTSYTNPNGDFQDITSGSNGKQPGDFATVGYDTVTGLGSPVANKLIPDLIIAGSSTTSPAAASFVGTDTTTQGTWSPTYGTDGYEVVGGQTSLPTYATVTPAGQSSYTWANNTTDPRALQVSPGSTNRVAAAWYNNTFTVDVNLTDSQAHQVSLYLLDYDVNGRSERIDVVDPSTGTVLDTRTVSAFYGGEYVTWSLTGHVQLRFTVLAGYNAVLEGIFFGAPQATGASATFKGTDTTTQGTWSPTYGTDGYEVVGGQTSLPTYATVTPAGQSSYTWANNTTDPRALQVSPGSTNRVAAAWYNNTFTVDVNLTDSQAHQVSLYLLDYDVNGRSERIDVVDPSSGTVLDTRTVSSFYNGEYVTWSLTGHVQLRFTVLAGYNAVLEGIFFGAPQATGASATFKGTDTTTQGTWSPTYGTDGYEVVGGQTSLPTYATVTPAGQSSYTWANNTTDPRALQVSPGSTNRVAAAWYNNTFTVDVNLTDSQAHQVSLYLLDYDVNGRSERIDVVNPSTGTVLDTRTVSSFYNGEYLTWSLTGHVQFRFTVLAGYNAVLNGILFGA